METYAPPVPFVDDPGFARTRERILAELTPGMIEAPLRDLVARINALPHAVTLQCCRGHFVHAEQPDAESLARLPGHDPGPIEYRLAYLAFALEAGPAGARLREELATLVGVAPGYVQFGSPTWFRDAHPNSYALQVEPGRFADRDTATVDHREALRLQAVRDEVFARLEALPSIR